MDFKGFEMMTYSNHKILLLVFFLSPLLLVVLSRRRRLKLPPSPFAWPIVGNLFNLEAKKPHIALANLAKSLGPLFTLRLGSRTVVVVSSPEAAREVYKIHDKELSGRFHSVISTKLTGNKNTVIARSAECNQEWKSLRGMSHTHLFSSQALESNSHFRTDKAREMVQVLSSKEGEVVRIADIIFATIVNSLSMAMTSQVLIENWNNIEETKLCLRKIISFATPRIGDLYPVLAGLDFGINKTANDCINVTKGLWGHILVERKCRGQEGSPDMLDFMIKNSWDDLQIFNMLTEFLAGAESMTTATEWAITELARSPEALTKLQEELVENIGEEKVLHERDIEKLPFLQACIKETFRLHPPSPFLVPRVAVQACKVMNYDIPKGCLVITNAYAMGRDPKVWEDPNGFKPERFLGKSLDVKGTNYELLPFGGGRRICAGHPLALKQIQLLLASIVSAFDWSNPSDINQHNADMGEEFSITLRKEKPMLLILKKRGDLKID